MRQFTDSTGKTWNVTVNVAAMLRVKDMAGVDLIECAAKENSQVLKDLYCNPVVLTDVAYAVVSPTDVAKAQFSDAMDGKALAGAKAAILEELMDFFGAYLPNTGRLMRLWLTMVQEKEAVLAKLAAESMRATSGKASGDSPASAA